ncbi:MAG TPA: response regulator [Gemmatimonadaceae bacterium]|nr:response regulator [Gemmatimonadaceae bacterium]
MREPLVTPGCPRVLIVDDERAIVSALVNVLRRAGFDPIPAFGASEADALLSEAVSAMVLDLRMQHMRGDVFFYIASARFPVLRRRTLFITGDITPEAERLIGATGCGCLWKPFPNSVLVDAIRALLPDYSVPTVVG